MQISRTTVVLSSLHAQKTYNLASQRTGKVSSGPHGEGDNFSYCRTELFCELIVFAIEPFANIVNTHLFSMSMYITKAEPRMQKL